MENEVSEIKFKGYILYVPSELLARAAEGKDNPASKAVDGIIENVEDFVSGKIGYILLPSDTFDNGTSKFYVKFID